MELKNSQPGVEKQAEVGKRPSRRVLVVAAVLVAILYGAGLNSHWRFQRDSAVYMGLARSLVEGDGYTVNHEPHTKYTPGLPAMLAATGAVFGVPKRLSDSFFAYNVLLTLLGLGSILLFYFVLRELDLPPAVFLATFLFFVFSRSLYYYSTHLMTDVPFTFFSLLALLVGLVAVRREGWNSWVACAGCGVAALVASTIRPVGPLLLLAVTGSFWLRRGVLKEWRERAGKTAILWAPSAIGLSAYALWTRFLQPEGGRHYTRGYVEISRIIGHLSETLNMLGDHFGGISDTLLGTDAGSTVGVILSLVLILGLVGLWKRGDRQLSLYALLMGGVIVAGGWDLGRRYLLPVLPVMFLWLVLGGYTIGKSLRGRFGWWTSVRVRRLGYVCVGLVLLVNLIRIGDVIREQRGGFYEDVQHGKLLDYEPIFEWLRENETDPGEVTVGGYEATTIHYFTRLRTKWTWHRDTGDWSKERTLEWLEDVDYLVEDAEKPESTAAFERHLPTENIRLESVMENGDIRLLRVALSEDKE